MRKVTIGRNADNNIVIADQSVSGYHADLEIHDNGEMIFRDHSTNGTMVNGNYLHNDFCYVYGNDNIVFPGQHKLDWSLTGVAAPAEAPAAVSAPAPQPAPQPVYQQPAPQQPAPQPVYQQPAPQPVYQQPVPQPVYQQPVPAPQPAPQPVYQQPAPQQLYQIGDISFTGVLTSFWKNYFNFSGRARRKEYWLMMVWNMIFGIIPIVGWLVLFLSCIGAISLAVRRLHDSGKSGFFLLLGLIPFIGAIILFVFYCQDSERGANKWGPSSKYINA